MKLSIITINYNNKNGLRKTMESVSSQSFSDFEFVVVDGGSSDGSADLLNEFGAMISYGISEPDHGVYQAMNKGIRHANGDYLLFLNSGDWLFDDTVIEEFLNCGFNEDIVDGNVCILYGNRQMVDKSPETEEATFDFFFRSSLWHQAAFIRKDAFEKFGFYDESFRIVGDWDFFMRAICFQGATYIHWDRTVSYYPFDGISSIKENELLKYSERERGLLKYIPKTVVDSYSALGKENEAVRAELDEYHRLKQGKFGFMIRFMLYLKKRKKQSRSI